MRIRGFVITWVVVGLILGMQPLTAQPSASAAMQQARQLGQEAKWAAAVEVLEKSVKKQDASNPAAWYQLAQAYEHEERWDDAIKAIDSAMKKGFQRVALGNLLKARAFVGKGMTDKAFAKLEETTAGGPNRALLNAMNASTSLQGLQDDPRYAKVAKALTPCSDEPYRQFDFWLGDYRVEDPAGNQVGENNITLHMGGCMLLESWKGLGGTEGMSMNFYDPVDKTWNQTYLDNTGKPRNWPLLKGKFEKKADSMVLWTEKGKKRSRWTWKKVAEGKVRQMAEQTLDGGKTWQVTWDSYYILKSEN